MFIHMLAMRYLILHFISLAISGFFLLISFSSSYFIYSFSLFSVPAWVGLTAWWVSPCVGVSLCVDVRLCRVSSCTWPVGDALVSRGLVSGV